MNIPTHRVPSHPGEIIMEEFLTPLGISQATLASALHIPYQRINEITNKKRGISPSTALRLSRYFDTTPGFWMNLQLRWDMYHALKKEEKILEKIHAFIP
ncbi:MAG: HigA family addiction module antitoxin [Saprospiraceae bacterium]